MAIFNVFICLNINKKFKMIGGNTEYNYLWTWKLKQFYPFTTDHGLGKEWVTQIKQNNEAACNKQGYK